MLGQSFHLMLRNIQQSEQADNVFFLFQKIRTFFEKKNITQQHQLAEYLAHQTAVVASDQIFPCVRAILKQRFLCDDALVHELSTLICEHRQQHQVNTLKRTIEEGITENTHVKKRKMDR